jgi:hypothetical protein
LLGIIIKTNKAVKETLLATAESLAFNNYRTIAGLPAAQQESEILKIVSSCHTGKLTAVIAIDGQMAVLKQFLKAADDSGNFDLVDKFVNMNRGDGNPYGATPGMQEVYVTGKRIFDQKQGAQLSKFNDDQLQSIVANYTLAFATGDPDQIRQAQKDSYSSLLKIGSPEAKLAAAEILNDNAGDAPAIKQALELADDKGYLDKRFLDANRSKMTKGHV